MKLNKLFIFTLLLISLSSFAQETIKDNETIKQDLSQDDLEESFSSILPKQKLISDPLESVNRKIYGFNKALDNSIVKPVTLTYQDITPHPVQKGITNFLNYLKAPINIFYFSLQGNGEKAANSMGRFVINTLGFGLIDFASEANIPLEDTTFGETLGTWGVGEGPYIVIPILGGGTLRDSSSQVIVDIPIAIGNSFPTAEQNTLLITKVIETRKDLLPFDKSIEEGALDEYSFVRDSIVKMKRNSIENLK